MSKMNRQIQTMNADSTVRIISTRNKNRSVVSAFGTDYAEMVPGLNQARYWLENPQSSAIVSSNESGDDQFVEGNFVRRIVGGIVEKESIRREGVSPPEGTFKAVQKWFGEVQEIDDNIVIGRMENLFESGEDELLEIGLDEISPDDREFIQPGALFYFYIGYFTRKGQRVNQLVFKLKRRPQLGVKDIDSIADKAQDLFGTMDWE